jgi:hypothetical protein
VRRLWADVCLQPPSDSALGHLLPLRMDTPFKRAFRDHDTLAALLNAVMGNAQNHRVVAVNNSEFKASGQRTCILDVHCTLDDGSKVIVEVQKALMRDEIVDRLYGYTSRVYSEQWLPGGGTEAGVTDALVPIRTVAIVDFTLEASAAASGAMVQHYSMGYTGTGAPAPSALQRYRALSQHTVVQLPLAPTKVTPGLSPAQLWAHLLRYSETYSPATLPEALLEPPYAGAVLNARADSMTRQERAELEEEDKAIRDAARVERYAARAERTEQAEARAEQAEARARELARKLTEELTAKRR